MEIAGAALRCFGRWGFQGTSVADIIAESGLSAGAIQSIRKDIVTDGLLLQVLAEAMTDPYLRRMVAGTVAELQDLFAGYLVIWYPHSRGLAPAEASARAGKYAAVMLGACQGFPGPIRHTPRLQHRRVFRGAQHDRTVLAARTLLRMPDGQSAGPARVRARTLEPAD
ncbi:MAG: TetR/AcrR family transcriptional regulator [Chloroflexota bacterium]|nr:TetR/AcrR family transcriptional regulator [Chloroflexota bacterium]